MKIFFWFLDLGLLENEFKINFVAFFTAIFVAAILQIFETNSEKIENFLELRSRDNFLVQIFSSDGFSVSLTLYKF